MLENTCDACISSRIAPFPYDSLLHAFPSAGALVVSPCALKGIFSYSSLAIPPDLWRPSRHIAIDPLHDTHQADVRALLYDSPLSELPCLLVIRPVPAPSARTRCCTCLSSSPTDTLALSRTDGQDGQHGKGKGTGSVIFVTIGILFIRLGSRRHRIDRHSSVVGLLQRRGPRLRAQVHQHPGAKSDTNTNSSNVNAWLTVRHGLAIYFLAPCSERRLVRPSVEVPVPVADPVASSELRRPERDQQLWDLVSPGPSRAERSHRDAARALGALPSPSLHRSPFPECCFRATVRLLPGSLTRFLDELQEASATCACIRCSVARPDPTKPAAAAASAVGLALLAEEAARCTRAQEE